MVARRRSRRLSAVTLVIAVLAALLATAAPAPAGPSSTVAAVAAQPAEQPAILFAADGMRPDLVDRFAATGAMPNLRELKRRGV
jgi:predicted AlkP superfamily pyrophosphatase or phosphodiesterase